MIEAVLNIVSGLSNDLSALGPLLELPIVRERIDEEKAVPQLAPEEGERPLGRAAGRRIGGEPSRRGDSVALGPGLRPDRPAPSLAKR